MRGDPVHHGLRGRTEDREVQVLPTGVGADGDGDDFAGAVHHGGAARTARNGRGDLHEPMLAVETRAALGLVLVADGGDDADGERASEAVGAAEHDDLVPLPGRGRGEAERGEDALASDLNDGKIAHGVLRHDARDRDGSTARQGGLDARGVRDDVLVRHDAAPGRDEEAGARALLRAGRAVDGEEHDGRPRLGRERWQVERPGGGREDDGRRERERGNERGTSGHGTHRSVPSLRERPGSGACDRAAHHTLDAVSSPPCPAAPGE